MKAVAASSEAESWSRGGVVGRGSGVVIVPVGSPDSDR